MTEVKFMPIVTATLVPETPEGHPERIRLEFDWAGSFAQVDQPDVDRELAARACRSIDAAMVLRTNQVVIIEARPVCDSDPDSTSGCEDDECMYHPCDWCAGGGCQACGWTGHKLDEQTGEPIPAL